MGIFALDTASWQRKDIAIETPIADLIDPRAERVLAGEALVFDQWKQKLVGVRYVGVEIGTLWFDPELTQMQRTLAGVDQSKRWEIIEWDEKRTRFLVRATSNMEPGIYYVFHAATNQLDEIMSRAPWLTAEYRNPGTSFGFRTKAGVAISGYLTTPRNPILKRPPLVVLCHDGPWSRDYPGYDREAQALATMGFVVLQVNYRGSTGFGRKHLDALRGGYDTVALEDVMTALDVIAPKGTDKRLVAIMGSGYGGYLALRAMQLYPDRFRCAVAVNAPTNLAAWVNPPSEGISFLGEMRRAFFGNDVEKLRAISPVTNPELIKSPVMIVESEGFAHRGGRGLVADLKKRELPAEFVALTADESADLPKARGALFERIRGFINENIYHYAVKMGEAKKVE
jgi:pimeloyl-ACP methyl ester carboxylesterase